MDLNLRSETLPALLARCDQNGCLTSFWYCIHGRYEGIPRSTGPQAKDTLPREKSVNLCLGSRGGRCPPKRQPHHPVDRLLTVEEYRRKDRFILTGWQPKTQCSARSLPPSIYSFSIIDLPIYWIIPHASRSSISLLPTVVAHLQFSTWGLLLFLHSLPLSSSHPSFLSPVLSPTIAGVSRSFRYTILVTIDL